MFSTESHLVMALLSSSFGRLESHKQRLANMTLDEFELYWAKLMVRDRQKKAAKAIARLAQVTGPWRHFHLKHTKPQSSNLNRLLKKGKAKR